MRKDFLAIKIRSITIIAPERSFLIRIKRAFELIKRIDLVEYEKLFSRIDAVLVTRIKDLRNNGFYMPGKIWILNQAVANQSIEFLASAIIHEGIHGTQFKNNKRVLPKIESEEEAAEAQRIFLEKLDLPEDSIMGRFRDSLREKKGIKDRYWEKFEKDKVSKDHFKKLWAMFLRMELELTYINL